MGAPGKRPDETAQGEQDYGFTFDYLFEHQVYLQMGRLRRSEDRKRGRADRKKTAGERFFSALPLFFTS
jgi:hypothetical protein